VKDSKNRDSVAAMKVRDHIGESGNYQLPRAVDTTRTSQAWMLREHSDVLDNLEHAIDGGRRVVTTDVLLNPIEVATSGARPLEPHVCVPSA